MTKEALTWSSPRVTELAVNETADLDKVGRSVDGFSAAMPGLTGSFVQGQ